MRTAQTTLSRECADRRWHNQPVPLTAAANLQPAHLGHLHQAFLAKDLIMWINIVLALEVVGLAFAIRFWFMCREDAAAFERSRLLRIKARS